MRKPHIVQIQIWLQVLVLLFLTACGPGCVLQSDSVLDQLVIVSWNVENLFDGDRDGLEYAEFNPDNGAWDARRYHVRLKEIAAALDSIEPVPDVICLQEIEGEDVLADLVRVSLGAGGLKYYAATRADAAIQVGIISRFPLSAVFVHEVGETLGFSQRPVLECQLKAGGEELVIYVNHWKSKLEGAAATEPARIAAAEVLKGLTEKRSRQFPQVLQIIAGDLNESADERFRTSQAYETALADCPGAGLQITGDSIRLGDGLSLLYDPWLDDSLFREEITGSYRYRGEWLTLDHIICGPAGFDGKSWEFADFAVIDDPPFAGTDGFPSGWNPASGLGCSDHLPVSMTLVDAGSR